MTDNPTLKEGYRSRYYKPEKVDAVYVAWIDQGSNTYRRQWKFYEVDAKGGTIREYMTDGRELQFLWISGAASDHRFRADGKAIGNGLNAKRLWTLFGSLPLSDSLSEQIALLIPVAGEIAMSDEERQVLLARMQASIEEAKTMTRDQARARLAEEQRRADEMLATAFGTGAVASA